MPERSADQSGGLGALLVLLHGVSGAFRSIEVTYRVWRHQPRLHEAFVAAAEARQRGGGSATFTYGTARSKQDQPEPDEREEAVRIWRDGQRVREERHGGDRDGYYAVADPPLWWMWDERMGARSNQDDPSVGSGVGQEMELMLDPTPLLSSVRFRAIGRSEIAGRAAITAHATPRPVDDRFGPFHGLGQLGTGADYYRLEIDAVRGVLLAATAIRADEPFHEITTRSIVFDRPVAPERFRFEPPEGEEIQPTWGRPRMQSLTLVEAQRQASFNVFMPDKVPENWQVQCRLIESSRRPPSPSSVHLSYRSTDGHESISISQQAADRDHPYNGRAGEDNWENVTSNDTAVKARPADWGQAQVQFERQGTYVYLMSDNLTRDQLVTIAVNMRLAPDTSSI